MTSYNLLLVVLGVAILAVSWLPSLLKNHPLSYPTLVVGFGLLLYALPFPLPDADPIRYKTLTTHLSELCVIVALTGTGLKIDRPFSVRTWRMPIRLVLYTMILTIAGIALSGWLGLGLHPASAMLLAASLAPTDPVLASDVQVGDPGEGGEDNVRFALTGEAGLNDGLAFPFVYGAIALLPSAASPESRLIDWLTMDVLYRVSVGLLAGWLSGRLLSALIFGLPQRISIKTTAYSFVILAVTLTTYGLTELVKGYGFLAVFIAAITLRGYERSHEYHQHMHDFSDQIERVFIVILLLLFGGAIGQGLLAPLRWSDVALGLGLLFIIRPLAGFIPMAGTRATLSERWVIAGFGIRGIGSFFYLSFGLEKGNFPEPERLWAILGFVVLVSIVMHGMLATPVMNWLDRRHNRLETKESVS
ncbi:sodium:proton antiporter [Fibrisoma montanum]|uniref:Sodium:proton antiporter n=1 Tax=Fibrisoma montanum TaxID=2305895 RepID=A0A418LY09_9BACT|nr:cation:proton antiporter [Fibrisoma montanum]RIV18087.1 sodium:proton antiporter [Fibrisoma montanum]